MNEPHAICSEYPRERLKHKGPQALSVEELLAIILSHGNKECSVFELAKRIAHEIPSLWDVKLSELEKVKGIGLAKASKIIAALELGKRWLEASSVIPQGLGIHSANDVWHMMRPRIVGLKHEVFWVLYVTIKNKVEAIEMHSQGTASEVNVNIRDVFSLAVKLKSSGIICIHNHPSGDPKPSPEDVVLTTQLHEAAKTLQIRMLDHIICTPKNYYSFAEHMDSDMVTPRLHA